ncbi:nucleoside triphosphate pyrophosphohydrolase family protein [Brucella pecoris]|uniref:Pyrophosphatase n=1 Tax=Brucella pecoris TaxID=867683 RepID=A0A5C5CE37_9HYPH|nr:nucleoside triphosphate pyrophosphohydrolase family protein [Brucella pecoris]MBB4095672.1 NTP pyrophosphatase (non-canonical NTP hydrolase) [Brucella pecoris]TNV09627.1 pyrophosphatase [Brucella pecoris]
MTETFMPLSVDEYALKASRTDQRSDGGSMTFPLLGLFGETGSLLSEVKKKQRDRTSYMGYASAVAEELGDVLWYLTIVADRANIALADIVSHVDSGQRPLTFSSIQPAVMPRRTQPTPAFERTLLQLAGAVGGLMADHEAGRLLGDRQTLVSRLRAVTGHLVQAANESGTTLEAAAIKNLAKIDDRWPLERVHPELLDSHAVAEEQLPRDLRVEIFERDVGARRFVFQRCNGLNIGDRLTDNAMTPDDYRFHDVFHYAYVATLGWSPVIRALFRLKRKSTARIDEAQDGARAILIEEGVTTWIFGQAVNLNLFSGMGAGDLPFDLLKNIRQFVGGYEVETVPLWLWEDAILQGYAAFRFLREHRRGLLHIDTAQRRLRIEELP